MSIKEREALIEQLWEMAEEVAAEQGGNDYLLQKLAVGLGPLETVLEYLKEMEESKQ